MAINDEMLNKAVVLYVGYKIAKYPQHDEMRLVREFGVEDAAVLKVEIEKILATMSQLQPDWEKHTLWTAAKWAGEKVLQCHPGLNKEAIEALEWEFSWWWK